jgi:hypothetical protein
MSGKIYRNSVKVKSNARKTREKKCAKRSTRLAALRAQNQIGRSSGEFEYNKTLKC